MTASRFEGLLLSFLAEERYDTKAWGLDVPHKPPFEFYISQESLHLFTKSFMRATKMGFMTSLGPNVARIK